MEGLPKEKKTLVPFFLAGFVLITVGGILAAIIYYGPKNSGSLAVKGVDTFSDTKSQDLLAVNPTEKPFIHEDVKVDKKTTWSIYSNNILSIEFKYSPEFTFTENVTGGAKDVVDFIAGDKRFEIERTTVGIEQSGPFKINSTPKEVNGNTWQMVAADPQSSVSPSYSLSRNGYEYLITYTPNMEKDMQEILQTFKFTN